MPLLRRARPATCRRRKRKLRLLTAAIALLAASAASAVPLPKPEEIALPEERTVLSESVLPLITIDGPEKLRNALDATLKRLNRPTPLRGYVQFLRASVHVDEERHPEAREAIEESIRLLPEYSGPLLLASDIYAYSDQPARGVDYLIRASHIDPVIVSRMPDYEVKNLFHRLGAYGDDKRSRQLSVRLIEIGWLPEGLSARSDLARRGIEAHMAEGRLAAARALIPKLVSPAHSRLLLMDNRYRELWPHIEQWAGPKLEVQWRVYLAEARAAWVASKDAAAAVEYAQALRSAGHDRTLIRELLPEMMKPLDAEEDQDLLQLASPLASALGAAGRWDELEAMYANAAKAWPLGSRANALNIAANQALHLLYGDQPDEALKAMNAAIADARQWGAEVNADAVTMMHQNRACILHTLGRHDESLAARTNAVSPPPLSTILHLQLCLGEQAAAKRALIAAFETELRRQSALTFVQETHLPPSRSEFSERIHRMEQVLRIDPEVIAAAAKHGRVLPFSLSDGAPAEQPPTQL